MAVHNATSRQFQPKYPMGELDCCLQEGKQVATASVTVYTLSMVTDLLLIGINKAKNASE